MASPAGGQLGVAGESLAKPSLTMDVVDRTIEALMETVQRLREVLTSPELTKGGSSMAGGPYNATVANHMSYKDKVLTKASEKGQTGEGLKIPTGDVHKKAIQIRSSKRPRCFQCGSFGHFAKECRDPVLCFRCGRLGHRSWQCRAAVGPPPGKPLEQPSSPINAESVPLVSPSTAPISPTDNTKPSSSPDLESRSDPAMATITKFNSTPASKELEAALKRSIYLANTEGWGRERFLENLRAVAPFQWRVAEWEGGFMLVEGPKWWAEQALKAGKVILEGKDILVEPWEQSRVNGFRLKSVWVRVLGFPIKLWHRSEFERLIEKFGVLLEIDRATDEKTSLIEAKIRIGVSAPSDIPATGKAFFRNDAEEWVWTPVRFVIDTPGLGKKSMNKRKRTWVRKPDPPNPEPIDQDPVGDDEYNDEDLELELNDEDLLEQEENVQDVENNINATQATPGSKQQTTAYVEKANSGIIDKGAVEVNTGTAEKSALVEIGDVNAIVEKTGGIVREVLKIKETSQHESVPVEDMKTEKGKGSEKRAGEGDSQQKKEEAGLQMVVYQAAVKDDEPTKTVVPRVTRQSLRQKLKDPDRMIQDKAVERAREKNLEIVGKGKTPSLDKFPFTELSDMEVLDLFDCCGIVLADFVEEGIENVQFLRTLSKQQFLSSVEEMEFKTQYGPKFAQKEKDKQDRLNKIVCGVKHKSLC